METLEPLEMADDSSENSGMVKSEDGSPSHGTGRGSPPPNCAICLGRCRNKSFTDSCLHQFCFKCLVTWSRVKSECPLCKQNFKSIIHNVKSNLQYEEYQVQQPESEDLGPNIQDFSDIFNAARRFRYRTTLTLPRRETMAIRQFLMHYPLAALINDPRARPPSLRDRARRSPADFRRTVYRHNLWARPLPDFTGRFRDSSPDFFRYNDSQVHRLVPWLSRELFYLLNENDAHVTYVLGRILELLPQYPIMSEQFRTELQRYLGDRTSHFLHEFHCFASTPYDITGYDRHVQYHTGDPAAGGAPGLVSEVLSSSDSDDSDLVMVSSTAPPVPGTSRGPSRAPPVPGSSRGPSDQPPPAYPPAVIPIETILHSDTSDSDSEVVVVGYIKPPHQRTPELVDLLASDSDVVVQEDEPAPAAEPRPAPAPATVLAGHIVRVQMSVPDAEPRAAAPPRRRRRDPPPFGDTEDDDSASTSSSDARSKRTPRRKPRRKPPRGTRNRARLDGREPRRAEETRKSADEDGKSKGKSRNGKDVKSSKVEASGVSASSEPAPAHDRPGPSGLEVRSRRKRSAASGPPDDEPGPSNLENGSRRIASAEPAPALDRPGPSELEAGSRRKRNAEPRLSKEEPGPSGLQNGSKKIRSAEPAQDQPGPSGIKTKQNRSMRKPSTERASSPDSSDWIPKRRLKQAGRYVVQSRFACPETRQDKRLKSIVKVIKKGTSTGADSSETRCGHADVASGSAARPRNKSSPDLTTASHSRDDSSSTSSDDDIPLRTAMSKIYRGNLARAYVSDFSD